MTELPRRQLYSKEAGDSYFRRESVVLKMWKTASSYTAMPISTPALCRIEKTATLKVADIRTSNLISD
jgi:hypothetical protein